MAPRTRPAIQTSVLTAAIMAAVPAYGGEWSGAYAGLGGGYQTSTLDSEAPLGDDRLELDLGASGALLSGYGGYGWNRGSLYLGGEASYGFNMGSGSLRLDDREFDYRARDTLGLSGVMGGLLTPDTLLYGRAGYQHRRSDVTLSGFRDRDWTDGLRLGAGAELRLWDRGSIRVEYSHTWNEERSIQNGDDEVDLRARETWFEAGGILRF